MKSYNPQQFNVHKEFEKLDESLKQSFADIKSPLILGMIVLAISDDQGHFPYLSAREIEHLLETSGKALKRNQIIRAFSRAGDRISRKKINGEIKYRIMTSGRRQVDPIIKSGALSVFYVQGGTPRTARKMLSELLLQLNGVIRISDPYYGIRSLDTLEMIPSSCTVKFLTAVSPESPIKLSGAISDFEREHPTTELRKYPDTKTLHDRYIISQDMLLILGQGIKDIGNKETFVICISSDFAEDLIRTLTKTFDDRWNLSSKLA